MKRVNPETVAVMEDFCAAIHERNFEKMKALSTNPLFDVNCPEPNPTFVMIWKGSFEMISWFLSLPGFDIGKGNDGNALGSFFIHRYRSHGRKEFKEDEQILDLLLSHPGINLNRASKAFGTPLFIATDRKFSGTVLKLLRAGADPSIECHNTYKHKSYTVTPLEWAKLRKHEKCIKAFEEFAKEKESAATASEGKKEEIVA